MAVVAAFLAGRGLSSGSVAAKIGDIRFLMMTVPMTVRGRRGRVVLHAVKAQDMHPQQTGQDAGHRDDEDEVP